MVEGGDGSSRTLAMAGEAGGDPRAWLAVDETAAAFLSRSLSTRPPILLPPPLHRAPLRPGNVVEITGPSNSGKSQLLLMAAVQCILPKEWEGAYFGGLGKAVMYLDLDCRFDVLRLAQILRNRIAEGRGSAHPTNEELEKDGTKDKFHCSFEHTLFSDCMKRFLYVRCYNSSELIAALKSLHSQSESRGEVLGIGVYFLMIDSIGAFYWIDRGFQPIRESKGKTLSLQNITETVVQEIRKILQLQPVLVLVTKAHIYGEGITTANDFQRGTSRYMSEDSTVLTYSRQEEERNISCREYMPSVWQSFVTHRIKLQDLEEAGLSSVQKNEVLSIHTSEWVEPSLKTKEKFSIRDTLEQYWTTTWDLVPNSKRKGLDSLIILITWMIWKERNLMHHEHCSLNLQEFADRIKQELFSWSAGRKSSLANLLLSQSLPRSLSTPA